MCQYMGETILHPNNIDMSVITYTLGPNEILGVIFARLYHVWRWCTSVEPKIQTPVIGIARSLTEVFNKM